MGDEDAAPIVRSEAGTPRADRHGLRALVSESATYGFSGLLVRFGGLLLTPLFARIFTAAEFGAIALVQATVAFASIFVTLGLDGAAHRWYWDTPDETARRTTVATWGWTQLVVSVPFATLIWLAAPVLADRLGQGSDAASFRIAALSIPLSVLPVVLINWLRMQRRARPTAVFAAVSTGATLTATWVAVVPLDLGIAGVFWGTVAGALVATLIAAAVLGPWIDPRRFRASRLRDMLRFALPLIPAGVATWIIAMADRFTIEWFLGTQDVGLYQMGSIIAGAVALGTIAFGQAWGPWALSQHRRPDAGDVYARASLAYAFVGAVAATSVSVFAPELVRVIATDRFADGSVVVPWLTFAHVLGGLTFVAALGLFIEKRSRPFAAGVLIAAVVMILVNIALVPTIGLLGGAVGTLLAQLTVVVIVFVRSQQVHRIHFPFVRMSLVLAGGFLLGVLGERWPEGTGVIDLVVKAVAVIAFGVVAARITYVRIRALRSLVRRAA